MSFHICCISAVSSFHIGVHIAKVAFRFPQNPTACELQIGDTKSGIPHWLPTHKHQPFFHSLLKVAMLRCHDLCMKIVLKISKMFKCPMIKLATRKLFNEVSSQENWQQQVHGNLIQMKMRRQTPHPHLGKTLEDIFELPSFNLRPLVFPNAPDVEHLLM